MFNLIDTTAHRLVAYFLEPPRSGNGASRSLDARPLSRRELVLAMQLAAEESTLSDLRVIVSGLVQAPDRELIEVLMTGACYHPALLDDSLSSEFQGMIRRLIDALPHCGEGAPSKPALSLLTQCWTLS